MKSSLLILLAVVGVALGGCNELPETTVTNGYVMNTSVGYNGFKVIVPAGYTEFTGSDNVSEFQLASVAGAVANSYFMAEPVTLRSRGKSIVVVPFELGASTNYSYDENSGGLTVVGHDFARMTHAEKRALLINRFGKGPVKGDGWERVNRSVDEINGETFISVTVNYFDESGNVEHVKNVYYVLGTISEVIVIHGVSVFSKTDALLDDMKKMVATIEK